MPSARMRRPVPNTTSGTAPCADMSVAAQRALPCCLREPTACPCGTSLTCPTRARARIPGAWNPGSSPGKWNHPSDRCLKRSFMRTPLWASPRSWSRLPASRRSPTGAIIGGTSSTALTVPSFRSTMNSTSERRFARLQRPASPTACKRDAVWNRNCFGRTSPRCMTGIPLRPSRSLARLSA